MADCKLCAPSIILERKLICKCVCILLIYLVTYFPFSFAFWLVYLFCLDYWLCLMLYYLLFLHVLFMFHTRRRLQVLEVVLQIASCNEPEVKKKTNKFLWDNDSKRSSEHSLHAVGVLEPCV